MNTVRTGALTCMSQTYSMCRMSSRVTVWDTRLMINRAHSWMTICPYLTQDGHILCFIMDNVHIEPLDAKFGLCKPLPGWQSESKQFCVLDKIDSIQTSLRLQNSDGPARPSPCDPPHLDWPPRRSGPCTWSDHIVPFRLHRSVDECRSLYHKRPYTRDLGTEVRA